MTLTDYIEFEYHGLWVMAEIDPYDRGDYDTPPSGGTVEHLGWEVDDLDEVLLWAELESAEAEAEVEAYFDEHGDLPPFLRDAIEDAWAVALEEAAEAHYAENGPDED